MVCALVQVTLCPNCMSARCQQWAQVELVWLLYQVPGLAISCPWLLAAGIVLRAVWPPAPLAQLHPSIFSLSWQQSGHSPHCWPQPQQDVELSICVCISECMHFCSFFPLLFFSDFGSWLTFLPLKEFGKAMRFFFLHDFQYCSLLLSLSLSLCLLWLLSNRFHMLLQLTSVLNYFTCDLWYFLRKSVRYLLKDNKINLSCSLLAFFLLSFSHSVFSCIPCPFLSLLAWKQTWLYYCSYSCL